MWVESQDANLWKVKEIIMFVGEAMEVFEERNNVMRCI